jgi:chorismate mutase / prephenate dehydratase
MSDSLKKHREQIDAIDAQLLKLVNERAEHAKAIGALKGGGPIYRPEREAQVLRRLIDSNKGPLSSEAVTAIFRGMMANCRALEKELSVAFLGPKGTFSEEAAIKQFGEAGKPVECDSIDEVFRLLEAGGADYGVVPVENSTEGAVGRTLDLLVTTNLHICGEVTLPIHHCLIALVNDVKKINTVYSHVQSLGQCHGWLSKNLPFAKREGKGSNADAVKFITNPGPNKFESAAIASRRAADLYGAFVLAENIEDDPRNTTRFLVLATHDTAPSGQDKTSLVVAAKNVPGAVVSLLEPLAKHQVSMSKFESRPSKTGLWEYVFFIDIEGHQHDSNVSAALAELKQQASMLKVLGSYPVAVI